MIEQDDDLFTRWLRTRSGTEKPLGADEPRLDRRIQDRIGGELRRMYDGLLQQPVPDRFVELLKEMKSDPREGRA